MVDLTRLEVVMNGCKMKETLNIQGIDIENTIDIIEKRIKDVEKSDK